MRMLLKPVSAAILLLASHVPANAQNTHCSGDDQPPKLGAVASESAVCSRIGTDLLQSGGNAVDSIVGAVFCVGTLAAYHSGIGGGGFLLVRSSDGTYETVNFREMAPAAAHRDMYEGNFDGSLDGGLARYVDLSSLLLPTLFTQPRVERPSPLTRRVIVAFRGS